MNCRGSGHEAPSGSFPVTDSYRGATGGWLLAARAGLTVRAIRTGHASCALVRRKNMCRAMNDAACPRLIPDCDAYTLTHSSACEADGEADESAGRA
jgi:hypothetical protein